MTQNPLQPSPNNKQTAEKSNDPALITPLFILIMMLYSMFGLSLSYHKPIIPGGWALPNFIASVFATNDVPRMDELITISMIILAMLYGFLVYHVYKQRLWAILAIITLYLVDTALLIYKKDLPGVGVHLLFLIPMVFGLLRILEYREMVSLDPKSAVPEKQTGLARPYSKKDQIKIFRNTILCIVCFSIFNPNKNEPTFMALPAVLSPRISEIFEIGLGRVLFWLLFGMIALFAFLFFFAKKGRLWAFWVGAGLYVVDTGFAIYSRDDFAIFMHILFVLLLGWLLFKHIQAKRLTSSGVVIPDNAALEDLTVLGQVFTAVYQAIHSKTNRTITTAEKFALRGTLIIGIGLLCLITLSDPTRELGFLDPYLPVFLTRLFFSPDSPQYSKVLFGAILGYSFLLLLLGFQTVNLRFRAFVLAVIILGVEILLLIVNLRFDLIWIKVILLGLIAYGFKNYADMKKESDLPQTVK